MQLELSSPIYFFTHKKVLAHWQLPHTNLLKENTFSTATLQKVGWESTSCFIFRSVSQSSAASPPIGIHFSRQLTPVSVQTFYLAVVRRPGWYGRSQQATDTTFNSIGKHTKPSHTRSSHFSGSSRRDSQRTMFHSSACKHSPPGDTPPVFVSPVSLLFNLVPVSSALPSASPPPPPPLL